MTLEELISEGEALARPSFLLKAEPNDGGIVGYWGGERADMPDKLPPPVVVFSSRRHVFSVSEQLLAQLGISQGPVSLFEWESVKDETSYRVEADHRLQFSALKFSGEALYATASTSFPPFAAVCLYGSERVAAWLREQGLARHEYWRVSGDLPDQYDTEWQRRSPFYQQNADVVIGGWHFLWPDDDFYIPQELKLVALTLRDAEPWFELWHSPRSMGWQVKPRIT
ncbi:hypothetical protein [Prosthecobacter sp.]|uniref:hypothetical protein n=1 Tax=Prosthecobacter sp. TaxID=1965333 RepID=UPI0037843CE4